VPGSFGITASSRARPHAPGRQWRSFAESAAVFTTGTWQPLKAVSAGTRVDSFLRGLVEPRLQSIMADHAGVLPDDLTVLQHDQVRDAAHAVARRELRLPFGVDLEHERATARACGRPRGFGGGGLARAAPCRPKVDEHRNARRAHDLVVLGRA